MTSDQNERIRMDDNIETALKVLGGVASPDAMVSRIHRRLESEVTLHRVQSSRRFLIPVVGVAIAAMTLIAIFTQGHREFQRAAISVETAKVITTLPPAEATASPSSGSSAIANSKTEDRPVQFSAERRRGQRHANRYAHGLLSYPLTRQEKLLLQFAHNAKPADLQALNPEYRAKMEAQQDAEFAAYLKSGHSSNAESATQTTESTPE